MIIITKYNIKQSGIRPPAHMLTIENCVEDARTEFKDSAFSMPAGKGGVNKGLDGRVLGVGVGGRGLAAMVSVKETLEANLELCETKLGDSEHVAPPQISDNQKQICHRREL